MVRAGQETNGVELDGLKVHEAKEVGAARHDFVAGAVCAIILLTASQAVCVVATVACDCDCVCDCECDMPW